MLKVGLIVSFLLVLAAPVFCQGPDDFPFELNDAIVIAIQTIFGIGLMAIINLVKSGIKKLFPSYDQWPPLGRHALMYVVTLVLAAGATAFVLFEMKLWAVDKFILYTIYTWGYTNQFWKTLKEIIKKIK